MPLLPPFPIVLNGSNNDENNSMFSPQLLADACLKSDVSIELGNNLCLRPLSLNDYNNGYLDLLGQLTTVGDIDEITWKKTFNQMYHSGFYYIVVIEDLSTHKIIGTSTLFLEQKFIHNCAFRGRVEEVVVDKAYNGQGLGKVLMVVMVALAKNLSVYKLSLDCRTELITFYEKFGYKSDGGHYLVQRFPSVE